MTQILSLYLYGAYKSEEIHLVNQCMTHRQMHKHQFQEWNYIIHKLSGVSANNHSHIKVQDIVPPGILHTRKAYS